MVGQYDHNKTISSRRFNRLIIRYEIFGNQQRWFFFGEEGATEYCDLGYSVAAQLKRPQPSGEPRRSRPWSIPVSLPPHDERPLKDDSAPRERDASFSDNRAISSSLSASAISIAANFCSNVLIILAVLVISFLSD